MRFRIIATVGLLFCACAPAARAVVATLTADPGTQASGSYQITLTPTGATTYDLIVHGNNDGASAKRPANLVVLTFKGAGDGTVNITDATGLSGPGADPSGTFSGGPWTFVASPSNIYFGAAGTAGAQIGAFGGNRFTGSLTLADGDVAVVQALVRGGDESWGATIAIPEPAALGMVAAMLPVLARRRR